MSLSAESLPAKKISDLVQASGLMCLDFNLMEDSLAGIRYNLLTDTQLPPLLLLTSPSRSGLKLVLETDLKKATYKEWFTALSCNYHQTYCLEWDNSGSDMNRAFFMCRDSEWYINP